MKEKKSFLSVKYRIVSANCNCLEVFSLLDLLKGQTQRLLEPDGNADCPYCQVGAEGRFLTRHPSGCTQPPSAGVVIVG